MRRPSSRRPPQRAIEIGVEPERRERHPAVAHGHALGGEAPTLFGETGAAGRQGDAAIRAQHAMPWQGGCGGRLAQRAPDQARTARQSGAGSDRAVAGHAPARDGGNGLENAGMLRIHHERRARYHGIPTWGRDVAMLTFENIRSHIGGRHSLGTNDPYLISFDLAVGQRHQGIYLIELDGEDGRKSLRVSTPIGPLAGMDAQRCLRFNWEQRVGYLAVSDLEGSPYLHLCENRPYEILTVHELDRLIGELGVLGDQLEQAMAVEGDAL